MITSRFRITFRQTQGAGTESSDSLQIDSQVDS